MKRLARLFAVALAGAAVAVRAAAPPALAKEPMDEVVVRGARAQLAEMRRELLQLEERFIARYNELNTKREFDLACESSADTGTLLKTRKCEAVYVRRAREEYGRRFLETLQGSSSTLPPPAEMAIEDRRDEYRRNMVDVVKKSRDLTALASERVELQKRFDRVQRKLFGRKPPPETEDAAGEAAP